ncbi:MAG: hypothetical protein CVV25_09960 [Ignavibacteriae bacterium HGW-Ignavibacteriae-4]|jgi:hypothetical protein|nr:MAG: hypothetical protein CVV25_09960 [Ignavibacteriae bacterium HGW-Ignavibacteriae-4]
MLKPLIILIAFLSITNMNYAQDSTEVVQSEIKTVPASNNNYMSKSPSEALWKSVIPGWGQYYNEEYWKSPILFGAAVGLGSLIYYYNSEFNSYRDQLDNATRTGTKIAIEGPDNLGDTYYPIQKSVLTDLQIRQLKANKELNRDNRDMMAFYLLGVYVISAVDAYVGAHLYDFNVDDELSYNMNVNKFGYPEFALSYSF